MASTVNYVEKGSGMHAYIASQGYSLKQINGIWVSSNDAAVNAIISAYDPLATDTKPAACAAVDAQYALIISTPWTYNSHPYQIDTSSQLKIDNMKSAAIMSIGNPSTYPWPNGFAWIDSNNVSVPMDAPTMQQFGFAVSTHVSALITYARGLKNQINACTDAASVAAVNITTGWPP